MAAHSTPAEEAARQSFSKVRDECYELLQTKCSTEIDRVMDTWKRACREIRDHIDHHELMDIQEKLRQPLALHFPEAAKAVEDYGLEEAETYFQSKLKGIRESKPVERSYSINSMPGNKSQLNPQQIVLKEQEILGKDSLAQTYYGASKSRAHPSSSSLEHQVGINRTTSAPQLAKDDMHDDKNDQRKTRPDRQRSRTAPELGGEGPTKEHHEWAPAKLIGKVYHVVMGG